MNYKYVSTLPLFLLTACGGSPQDYLQKGNKLFAERKYVDAQLNYAKAIQKNPQLQEAHYKLGLALIKEDQGVAAFSALRRAVDLFPKDVDAKIALADVAFALYFTDRRRPK